MERELTCPVCRTWFQDPVMLHCTHHVCANHLEQILSGTNGLVPCPVCGDVTAMPEGGLTIDRSLQLVQEYWQEKQLKPHAASASGNSGQAVTMCGFCEEQTATRRCVQCDGVLCEACSISSHSKGFFKSHQIVDLETTPIATGVDVEVMQKMVCDVHSQEKLSFYCLDCRMPVCSHCLILGDHKGHQQKHIEEAYDTGKDTLNAWVEKLHQRIESCEEILEQLRSAELEVNQGAASQRNIINHEMDHLKELIETKRHQLLSKSALEEKQKRVQLQAQQDRTADARGQAQGMIHRSEDLLAVGSEHAFLAVVLPLIQDMKKLCTQPPEAAPTVSGNFRPLMTDTQVRSLGDLDLGVPKQPPQAAQVLVPSHSMPGMGGEAPLGYSLPQGFQQHHAPNAAATVSYLSASPAVHGQHVNAAQQPGMAYHSQVVYRAAMAPSH